jgi:hypothetical protein
MRGAGMLVPLPRRVLAATEPGKFDGVAAAL